MSKPRIRFEGYVEDWEQRKLGEITERVMRKNQNMESELPLTISAQYGLIAQNEFFDKRIASKDVSGYYLILNGEFAYNKSTSSDAPWGAVKRLDRYEKGVLSTLYIVFRIIDESVISSDFIATYYDTNNWHNEIYSIAAEGVRNHGLLNIAPSDFFDTTLLLPREKEEQQKIGEYFCNLDHLITLHQRKCDEIKKFKKLMLQKMFPQNGASVPEVRFDGFTEDWEQRKFGCIAARKSILEESSNQLPSVEYEDIISGRGILNKEVRDKESVKTGLRFDKGDVLFGKLRPYLKNWLLPDFSGIAVGDFWVLEPQNVDSSYLYYLIQTPVFENVANQSSGTKMPRSDWKLVSNTDFIIPSNIEEQEKIGQFFLSLDHLITLHQRKCDELACMKKFLLQNMFV